MATVGVPACSSRAHSHWPATATAASTTNTTNDTFGARPARPADSAQHRSSGIFVATTSTNTIATFRHGDTARRFLHRARLHRPPIRGQLHGRCHGRRRQHGLRHGRQQRLRVGGEHRQLSTRPHLRGPHGGKLSRPGAPPGVRSAHLTRQRARDRTTSRRAHGHSLPHGQRPRPGMLASAPRFVVGRPCTHTSDTGRDAAHVAPSERHCTGDTQHASRRASRRARSGPASRHAAHGRPGGSCRGRSRGPRRSRQH